MAKNKKAAKKQKNRTVKFYVFNTPLKSSFRRNASGYRKIFEDLFTKRVSIKLQGDRRMIIRSQYHGETKQGVSFLYGKIVRYTYVEGSDWLSTVTMERQNVTIPANVFPNIRETDYVFVPSKHRFAVVKNINFPPGNVLKFLREGLPQLLDSQESITANIVQSADVFDEIYSARQVKKILVKISYTNDDTLKPGSAYIDKLLKRSHIGEYEIKATADNTGNIEIEKNKQLASAIELSHEYGGTVANIIDNEGKKKRIFTEDHPKEFHAHYPAKGDKNQSIAQTIDQSSTNT